MEQVIIKANSRLILHNDVNRKLSKSELLDLRIKGIY